MQKACVGNLLRQLALTRARGHGSNLYNRVHGNLPQLYVEQLYNTDEILDTVPHSSDPVHHMFPKCAGASPLGFRPYDNNKLWDTFVLWSIVYGVVTIFCLLHILKYPQIWKHMFETLTFQYTYQREIGEEYVWQYGGGNLNPRKWKFVKSPLEELGLVTEYRSDLDYPDDM
eukprot:GGOE01013521.1.p1 GENE.GGOE01013521.1~~GGOE01013521.1.p1  ORF type:complete len:172 (-),score=14.13 GGOE01013521.1:154-669(-)